MKSYSLISLLLLISCLTSFGQVTESQIRQKINLNVPTNGTKQISAVKLREVLSKMTDYAARTDSLALTRQAAIGYTPENATNKVGSLSSPSSLTFPNTMAVVTGLGKKADTSAVSAVDALARGRVPFLTPGQVRAGVGGNADVVFINDGLRSGLFRYNPANTTSTDDSSMVIRVGGRRLERLAERITPQFFGGNPNDLLDDTYAIQKAHNWGAKEVFYSPGTWLGHNIDMKGANVVGYSNFNTILKANGGTEFFTIGWDVPHFRRKTIRDVTIDGNGRTYDGIRFYAANNPDIAGHVVAERVNFLNCKKAIYKPYGNLGNEFLYCYFEGNDYAYYAVGDNDPFMHAGFDLIYYCTFVTTQKACIYINSTTGGTGSTRLIRPHFEFNPGFTMFIKNYKTAYTPLYIEGLWTELNATAATTSIDDTTYTTRELYLKNVDNFQFTHGVFGSATIINSHGGLDDMLMGGEPRTIDSLSVVNSVNTRTDGGLHAIPVQSLRNQERQLGPTSAVLTAPHRTAGAKNKTAMLNVPFQAPVTMGGSVGITGTVIAGGPTQDSCNRFVMATGQTNLTISGNLTTGRFYVTTVAIRQISDAVPAIHLLNGVVVAYNLHNLLKKGKWKTLAVVGKATETGTVSLYFSSASVGANSTFDLQALQVVEFYTEAEAMEFYRQAIY